MSILYAGLPKWQEAKSKRKEDPPLPLDSTAARNQPQIRAAMSLATMAISVTTTAMAAIRDYPVEKLSTNRLLENRPLVGVGRRLI